MTTADSTEQTPGPARALLGLAFASGMAALVYEVLWMRELRLLFGSTSQAAAATLIAFFTGLAAGNAVWGRRVATSARPLRIYALLEVGIAAAALLYFLLFNVYQALYSPIFVRWFGDGAWSFAAVKLLLALGILFPAAFFMGGTLPALGDHLVGSRPGRLGRTGATLYAVNTAGAALGAVLAGFFLPRWLGFIGAYAVAIAVNLAIAGAAWRLDRGAAPSAQPPTPKPAPPTPQPLGLRIGLPAIAFVSGFSALALEVLWTRMFEQILPNSVYTFAIILFVFLVALAVGSVIAGWLSRFPLDSGLGLGVILLLAGIAASLTPLAFWRFSGGFRYLAATQGWLLHLLSVLASALLLLGPPVLVLGTVFPYLFRGSEPLTGRAGRTLGRLGALNTLGAVLGSLAAGFLLLPRLGLWAGILLVSLLYLAAAVLFPARHTAAQSAVRALALAYAAGLLTLFNPASLPVVALDAGRQESLLEKWEGNAGTVAVIRQGKNLMIRVNSAYTIGDLEGRAYELRQGEIPLLLHGRAKSVFLIGLGTGISAGAVLSFPVDRVVVCELIPEVVTAARTYFAPHANGLFEDRRARIAAEDGRNFLRGTAERYDVIIGDLYVPFNAGTSALYAREHFEAARRRLEPDGLFVQWLPGYMLSREEFFIVARTLLEVFPQVTVWRGNFLSDHPILALVGHLDETPLDPTELLRRARELPGGRQPPDDVTLAQILRFYAGNLTPLRRSLSDYPVNTDNFPVIEYLAPISHGEQEAKKDEALVSFALAGLFDDLFLALPPEKDPYLSRLSPKEIGYVQAGRSLFKAYACAKAGQKVEARKLLAEFLASYPRGQTPAPE